MLMHRHGQPGLTGLAVVHPGTGALVGREQECARYETECLATVNAIESAMELALEGSSDALGSSHAPCEVVSTVAYA
jgi:hypothetical protein